MYKYVHVHVTAVIIYFLFALEAYDMSEELNKRSVISLDQLLNDPLTLSLFIFLSPWPQR